MPNLTRDIRNFYTKNEVETALDYNIIHDVWKVSVFTRINKTKHYRNIWIELGEYFLDIRYYKTQQFQHLCAVKIQI